LELAETDKYAIAFMVVLTGFLVAIGIGRTIYGDWMGAFFTGVIGAAFVIMAALGAVALYESAMKDSLPVLKVSLLIAVILSFAGVLSVNLAASIAAVVFVISPVFYDFMRDVILPTSVRDIPWHERQVGMRLIEIVVEAVIGAIISLVLALAMAGHV
jgi:hypothetical protein